MFRQRNKLSYVRKKIHKILGTRTQLYCSYAVANCCQEPEHAFTHAHNSGSMMTSGVMEHTLGIKHNRSKLLSITFCNDIYASNYPRVPGPAVHKYSLKVSALLDFRHLTSTTRWRICGPYHLTRSTCSTDTFQDSPTIQNGIRREFELLEIKKINAPQQIKA